MAAWIFNFTLISATDLQDVRKFGKMKVYAEVSINGEPNLTRKTRVDKTRGTNPLWNCWTAYSLPARYLEGEDMLVVKLYCKRSFKENKYVGELKLYLKKLFGDRESQEYVHKACYVNRVNDDGRFGELNIKYNFREKIFEPEMVSDEHVGQEKAEGSPFLLGVAQIGASIIGSAVLQGGASVILG